MTRPFRLEEDERRYFALRAEFFVRLVQSGAPTQVVHDIMRNFGKLEDFAFFEGVRQGMVTALLVEDQGERPALDAHFAMYGAASTPLVRREKAVAPHATHAWLSEEPMEFGPLTLTEAVAKYGPGLQVDLPSPRRVVAVPAAAQEPAQEGLGDLPSSEDDDEIARRLMAGEDPEVVFGLDGDSPPLQDPIVVDQPLQRPALLDQIRDLLLRLDAPPQTWKDTILLLMRELGVDAGYLDGLLSTPMGMNVISQAKLFHLHPGAMPEVKAPSAG